MSPSNNKKTPIIQLFFNKITHQGTDNNRCPIKSMIYFTMHKLCLVSSQQQHVILLPINQRLIPFFIDYNFYTQVVYAFFDVTCFFRAAVVAFPVRINKLWLRAEGILWYLYFINCLWMKYNKHFIMNYALNIFYWHFSKKNAERNGI